MTPRDSSEVSLLLIAREWGRIGIIGFGGPPAHISLLRERLVDRLELSPRLSPVVLNP